MRKSGKSGRLLLRQVVLNHGHSVPGFPLGSMRRWLELLPSSELSRDMDRCTVVLPRPGDGWYAPPSSGTSAGFPWGELTQQGADEMMRQGQRCARDWSVDLSKVLLRAANRASCISSAQAFALGGRPKQEPVEPLRQEPVEVLLQRGEALLPQQSPETAEVRSPELAQEIRQNLGLEGEEEQSELARRLSDEENLLEAVMSLGLRGEGVVALQDSVARRWQRLVRGGPGRVIGPLVGEVLGACDARLEGEEPGLVIYVVEAASLVCLQAALEATAPVAPWPSWGASLQLELWEVEGQLSLSLRPREARRCRREDGGRSWPWTWRRR
ncbi:unnamed protein product [Durusdinium trenchii]|uniref:Uncharacterized protein n=1 Tax=Durusdinium trenchii TaxID=1381693 RepID=A0ABP0LWM2_9DINO